MALLSSLFDLQKEQARAEGYAAGPAPVLNAANLNTQFAEGNPLAITAPLPPAVVPNYYPNSARTPNLRMVLYDMPASVANNFILIDSYAAASVTQQGEGGYAPFTVGVIQDHVVAAAGNVGSGASHADGNINCARFLVEAPTSFSSIASNISDGAAGSPAAYGQFAIYTADSLTLITQTAFPVTLTNTGTFVSKLINAPVTLPEGSYIFCWAAYGETVAGTAKYTGLLQNTLTAIKNAALLNASGAASVGVAANVINVLNTFPPNLGVITPNNNITAMPLVYLVL